jgi:hypothetical protein
VVPSVERYARTDLFVTMPSGDLRHPGMTRSCANTCKWCALLLLIWLLQMPCEAQEEHHQQKESANSLSVNWLYGAYIPKDAPLIPLSGKQRLKLYLRQSFTSPGIYVKTALFSVGDQIDQSPPEWGRNFGGYARRVGSRYGQFVVQNSFSTLGNALLRYEPRYDRCRCDGFWPRTGHALMRNFVTYNRTETEMRPQIALYAAALAAGMVSSTWKPRSEAWPEGYQSVITQAGFGLLSNWIGEFAPEITRVVRRRKPETPDRLQ